MTATNQNTLNQNRNFSSSILTWAVDHHLDFDFSYLAEQMEPEELALYKQCVIEEATTFFQSLIS